MTRFNDEWLIDRTLFDYTMGGGCACCSFNFMPGGISGLIQDSMQSELETDAIQDEINSLHVLPWPNDLKDQVWMERVRIRQLLKVDMKQSYMPFVKEHFDNDEGGYKDWLYTLEPRRLMNYFQLSRDDVQAYWNKESKYKIHAAFGTVLCGVVEQIANFPKTGYPTDGRGRLIHQEVSDSDTTTSIAATGEIEFEQLLTFDKRCGFTLKNLLIEDGNTSQKVANRDVLDVWLVRHKSLAGPKLLDRNHKPKKDKTEDGEDGDENDNDNENDDNDDADNGGESSSNVESKVTASFRADRRIVRLVIARIWANNLQAAYLKDMANQQEEEQS